ncbi:hypothetical protein ABBQ32_011690 [Trebouxia sp. C0010 RCD-2024]
MKTYELPAASLDPIAAQDSASAAPLGLLKTPLQPSLSMRLATGRAHAFSADVHTPSSIGISTWGPPAPADSLQAASLNLVKAFGLYQPEVKPKELHQPLRAANSLSSRGRLSCRGDSRDGRQLGGPGKGAGRGGG